MAPTRNESLIFNEVPEGFPEPGKTLKKVTNEIDLDAEVPSGSVLAKTIVMSLDPYMRGRMRKPEGESYVPAFTLGKPLVNFSITEVLKSSNSDFKVGQHLYGHTSFEEYVILGAEQLKSLKVIENKEGLPWSNWVGAAGMPSQTAYHGIHNILKPQKGETIFVSGASGAVGQMVIALAHAKGCKVIASAGTPEKVKYLKEELGVEVAFNYKTENTLEVLKKNPFEMYWDNVGAETLEAVFYTIKEFGRIVACGAIADYNTKNPYGIKNTFMIIGKSLKVEGFIILKNSLGDFYDVVPSAIASGKIHPPLEHIYKGLDNGEAFLDMLQGRNMGKPVISFE